MEFISQLERTVQGWLKAVPHLPEGARKWLGDNIWWIAAIGAVLTGIGVLGIFITLLSNVATLGSPILSYYASTTFIMWVIVKASITLAFAILECVLLALAVSPLKQKQKKGWVLLFAVLLLGVLSVVVSSILTFSVFGFIVNIIFGALWLAVSAYFLFEIHGQFAHVERSKGVKRKAASHSQKK